MKILDTDLYPKTVQVVLETDAEEEALLALRDRMCGVAEKPGKLFVSSDVEKAPPAPPAIAPEIPSETLPSEPETMPGLPNPDEGVDDDTAEAMSKEATQETADDDETFDVASEKVDDSASGPFRDLAQDIDMPPTMIELRQMVETAIRGGCKTTGEACNYIYGKLPSSKSRLSMRIQKALERRLKRAASKR